MSESNPSSSSSNLNVSNPLFIGSYDDLSTTLVSNIFNGFGFTSWKRSMIISLSVKRKFGLVDGSLPRLVSTSSTYSNSNHANSMVISWILNSLDKSIVESVLFLQTVAEIWKELNQRYEQSDRTLYLPYSTDALFNHLRIR